MLAGILGQDIVKILRAGGKHHFVTVNRLAFAGECYVDKALFIEELKREQMVIIGVVKCEVSTKAYLWKRCA